MKVFVQTPYDQYVNSDTRFWHASGIDLSLSATGLTVQTQSVLSILIGGIAFETSANDPIAPPAQENTVFTLYSNRSEAFNPPPRILRPINSFSKTQCGGWRPALRLSSAASR